MLAPTVQDRQSIGIVHRRTEIIDARAIGWREEEHAGERRNPDCGSLRG